MTVWPGSESNTLKRQNLSAGRVEKDAQSVLQLVSSTGLAGEHGIKCLIFILFS